MNTSTTRAGGMAIAVALLLVLVFYLIADAVSGPLLVTQPGSDTPDEVPLGAALVFTVLGGGVGIVLSLIANRLRRPRFMFAAVSVAALVLYGILPFTAADEASTAIWLNVMHVAAAVHIIGLIARAHPSNREESKLSETRSQRIAA